MRHEYLHKANHSLSFAPPRGCINHGLVLTSPEMSHKPGYPKSNHQEPGGSTSDCLTLLPNETCPKSDRQKPTSSTFERITLVLKKIHHVRSQNKIMAPFINDTHEIDITQSCNSLHIKYVDITKNMWTSERNADLLVNSNTTLINLLI